MGGHGLTRRRPRALGAARPVDAGPLEAALQDPHRGDVVGVEGLEEFDADPAGAPARMLPLEPAGAAGDGVGVGGRGRAAGVIADDQAIGPAIAEGAPEAADGIEGDGEFGGDLGQGLAAEMALDDVLPRGGGDGARHDEAPNARIGMALEEIIPRDRAGVELHVASGGVT
jgi:hypothetical protein